jgi:hypothetical protein
MDTVHAVVREGRVIPNGPVIWPDGTALEIRSVEPNSNERAMTEESWPTTAEGIAELVSGMDSRAPLDWREGEYEGWLAERAIGSE